MSLVKIWMPNSPVWIPVQPVPCSRDPEKWTAPRNQREQVEAERTCRLECPELLECQRAAQSQGEITGIWGGRAIRGLM